VMPHLARVSDRARAARSVNTVGFDAAGWWGETTDGVGFTAFLEAIGVAPGGARVVLLGAGGAARSLALALAGAGSATTVIARDPARVRATWTSLAEAGWQAWGSAGAADALAAATVVVQATPLEDPAALPDPAGTAAGAVLVDLRYGPEPTPWVRAARAAGRRAYDGLGLLVHQARASLALWSGREVPLEPLVRAVGWTP